jgi:hypothetical protein
MNNKIKCFYKKDKNTLYSIIIMFSLLFYINDNIIKFIIFHEPNNFKK